MTKYKFSVDGIPVAIYTLSEPEAVVEEMPQAADEVAISVAFAPDTETDLRVEYFSKYRNEPREPHIPLAALSCFLSRVRGYPDMTVELVYSGGIIKLTLDRMNDYNFTLKNEKCKILCTKNVDFLDGISQECSIINASYPYAILLCEDAECFDEGRLDLLFDRLKQTGITSLLILSFSEGLTVKTAGEISPYRAVARAVSYLSYRGVAFPDGYATAYVDGRQCKILKTCAGITFYPEIKYIS